MKMKITTKKMIQSNISISGPHAWSIFKIYKFYPLCRKVPKTIYFNPFNAAVIQHWPVSGNKYFPGKSEKKLSTIRFMQEIAHEIKNF